MNATILTPQSQLTWRLSSSVSVLENSFFFSYECIEWKYRNAKKADIQYSVLGSDFQSMSMATKKLCLQNKDRDTFHEDIAMFSYNAMHCRKVFSCRHCEK